MIGCLTPGTGLPTCLPVSLPNASPFLPCSSEERHEVWNSAGPAPRGFMESSRACMGRGGLRLFRADFLQSPSKEDLWLREDRVKGGCVEGSGSGDLLAAFAERQDAASSEPRHCITSGVPQCEWRPLELCSAQTVHGALPAPQTPSSLLRQQRCRFPPEGLKALWVGTAASGFVYISAAENTLGSSTGREAFLPLNL